MPLLLFAGLGGISLGGVFGYGIAKSINNAVLIATLCVLLWAAYKHGGLR